MTLKEIASVSGKGGLYHILKPTRTGVIVESLDEQQKKMVVGSNQRVSVLQEVSIYTTDAEGSVPLGEVFQKIHQEFGEDPGVDTSDQEELKAFMKHILPEYDEERVYPSDMKKLVNWYNILLAQATEVLTPEDEAATTEDTEKAQQGATSSEAASEEATSDETNADETQSDQKESGQSAEAKDKDEEKKE